MGVRHEGVHAEGRCPCGGRERIRHGGGWSGAEGRWQEEALARSGGRRRRGPGRRSCTRRSCAPPTSTGFGPFHQTPRHIAMCAAWTRRSAFSPGSAQSRAAIAAQRTSCCRSAGRTSARRLATTGRISGARCPQGLATSARAARKRACTTCARSRGSSVRSARLRRSRPLPRAPLPRARPPTAHRWLTAARRRRSLGSAPHPCSQDRPPRQGSQPLPLPLTQKRPVRGTATSVESAFAYCICDHVARQANVGCSDLSLSLSLSLSVSRSKLSSLHAGCPRVTRRG